MVRRLGYLSGAPRVSTRSDVVATGPRAHVLNTIGAFRALNWEVVPFIAGDRLPPRWAGPGSDETLSSGPLTRLSADIVRASLGRLNSWRAWREMSGRVDWVYERLSLMQALGRRPQRHGIPWILETNGPFFHEAKVDRKSLVLASLAKRIELRAYRQCDVLVCVSDALKEILVRESGISESKALVVPNGVDTAFFDPERVTAQRLMPGTVVGFVGGLIEWQRVDLLLDATARLRVDGLPISVVIVGDGPARVSLEARARSLGLEGSARFVGRIKWQEVPAYIAGFDLGYAGHQPSSLGSMYHSPLKLYEYLAMGKPALAGEGGDANRVVIDGETGFRFRPGDRIDLMRALLEAHELREQWPSIGSRARDLMVRKHSWVARVQEMIPQIDRILGAR